jgi:hypothetical protein
LCKYKMQDKQVYLASTPVLTSRRRCRKHSFHSELQLGLRANAMFVFCHEEPCRS